MYQTVPPQLPRHDHRHPRPRLLSPQNPPLPRPLQRENPRPERVTPVMPAPHLLPLLLLNGLLTSLSDTDVPVGGGEEGVCAVV
jgi:hypothetical protein